MSFEMVGVEFDQAGDKVIAFQVFARAGTACVEIRNIAVADCQRAVDNLVGNAARHGRRVRLTVRLLPRTLVISVEDDGPGIPAQDRMRAMQPFTRLEEARNQDEGGHVGLGLSIAMDVARAHGGGLELGDSADLGGLRAILRLPR